VQAKSGAWGAGAAALLATEIGDGTIGEHAISLGGLHIQRMMIKINVLSLVIAVLSFFACTKQESNQVIGTSPVRESSTVVEKTSQKSTGSFPVKILPETPTVLTNLQVVFSCTGSVTYEWRRNNQIIVGEVTGWLLKNQFVKGDEVAVTVTCDGKEGTALVKIGNSPPSVLSVPFSPNDIHAGVDITVKPVGYDPDGDDVEFHYKWSVNGNEIENDSPILTGDHFKRGDKVALTVIPYDHDGNGTPFASVNIVIPNGAPRILSSPPQEIHGEVYTYKVIAEDPDGDPITFSLVTAPDGMTIDSQTGEIKWPITEKSSGDHVVEIAVQDPGGLQTTQKYTITISLSGGGTK
jgi:putative Ig domain-containing protein